MSKKWQWIIGVVAITGIVWFIVTHDWLPGVFEDIVLASMAVDMTGSSIDVVRYLEEADVTIGSFVIKVSPFHLIYFVLSIGLISFALLVDLANPVICRWCSMLFSTLTRWKNN